MSASAFPGKRVEFMRAGMMPVILISEEATSSGFPAIVPETVSSIEKKWGKDNSQSLSLVLIKL